MSKPLQIIYNLDGLPDEAIKQYMRDVSIYFDLDPEVNWFDVLWMTDPDTGLRRRQLYARRGTTDVLRDKRSISVTDMVHHDGPGFVSFTAKGVNKAGRQEMAVGAHSTEGLKGEKLAAAVATAETRAGRRLTLKFCGLGILDYTEVTDPVEIRATPSDIENAGPAPIFAPSVAFPTPSAAPGKQVDRAAQDSLAQAKAEADEISRKALEAARIAPKPYPTYGTTAADFCPDCNGIKESPLTPRNQQSGLCISSFHGVFAEPIIVLRGDGVTIPVPSGASTVVDNTQLAPEVLGAPSTPILEPPVGPPPPKIRRTRKKPNTVDISTPGQVSANAEPIEAFDAQGHGIGLVVPVSPTADIPKSQPSPTPAPAQAVSAVPTQANPAAPPQVNSAAPSLASAVAVTAIPHPAHATMTLPTAAAHQPILAPPAPAPVTDFPGKPTKEQEATYREELRAYSNIILPSAGMVPSANIGGPSNKLRLYAERMSGKSTQQMTVDDWEDFFTQMKEFRATNGDKGLVKYINDVIGAK